MREAHWWGGGKDGRQQNEQDVYKKTEKKETSVDE